MHIGIIITARLGSSRLKEKHLRVVDGRPILYYLLERIKKAFQKEIDDKKISIIIATSDEPENRKFEQFISKGVSIFYGSQNNIPLRHLQSAEANQLDGLISVDGDDILCSGEGMKMVYQQLILGSDYIKTSSLPFGMNVMGYSTYYLRQALKSIDIGILETGWGRIFDESVLKEIPFKIDNNHNLLRFTLDYPEDFAFFKQLITQFPGDISICKDQEIVDYVNDNQLYKVTETIASEYWVNFNKGVEIENQQKRDDLK